GRKWRKIGEGWMTFWGDDGEVQLVVVDTLDKFADLDAKRSESDTGVIRETIDPLYPLLDLGVSVVLITHQRKEEGSHGLRVRGGTSLVGSADVIVEVERLPASANLTKEARVLKLVSRFTDAPEEIVVELGENGWRSIGTVRGAARQARREELLELLDDEPGTLEEILERAGLPASNGRTVRRGLNALSEEGLAERSGEGKRGDPYRWALSENGRRFRAS